MTSMERVTATEPLRPEPSRIKTAPSSERIVLRRKCSCGGVAGASGECEECRKKRLQRKGNGPVAAGSSAPQAVHDVLRAPGRPLHTALRTDMESRFGHNFSRVRIHDDAPAHASARAVDADAYTVAHNIVFAAGQFAPETPAGRRLLGHELTHVVQQRDAGAPNSNELRIGASDDPLEREADHHAEQISSLATGIHVADRTGPLGLQRAPRTPSTTPSDAGPASAPPSTTGSGSPPPPPPKAAPATICGPDVTAQVKAVLSLMNSTWAGWNAEQREEACWSLENTRCAGSAWDIVELHNNAWIFQDYRPACASAGGSPPCGSTVQVGSDCHYAGSVNYVVFGRMCDLCDIWETTMHAMIRIYKGHGLGTDPDYPSALAWAEAGYEGWPGAATPDGDRNNCKPICPTPLTPTPNLPTGAFDFHWVPTQMREGTTAGCNEAVDLHRMIRDNPPTPMPFGP